MIPLTGQILNTGHLMQPTANATGQSVMISLPSKSAAGLHTAVSRMVLPGTPDGATFHDTAGPLTSYPAARAVCVTAEWPQSWASPTRRLFDGRATFRVRQAQGFLARGAGAQPLGKVARHAVLRLGDLARGCASRYAALAAWMPEETMR